MRSGGRLARLPMAIGVTRHEAAVPMAIILLLLVVGATNPYLLAAFGLAPILLSIAWLDPFHRWRRAEGAGDGEGAGPAADPLTTPGRAVGARS